MNRRRFALTLPVAAVVGCDTDQKPSSTATLLNNADVQRAMQALSSSIDGLEGSVGRFDDENWREVVPEVEGSATDVRAAFDRLRGTLGVAG